MMPSKTSGKPIICRSQSSVTSSNSVDAGDVRYSIAFISNAAASISPNIPTDEADVEKRP